MISINVKPARRTDERGEVAVRSISRMFSRGAVALLRDAGVER
jgi:hypothetical protein